MSFEPSPFEAVESLLKDLKNALNTNFPARVVRYYPDRQTADVQPCVVRQVPGEYWEPDLFEEYPELVNIPVQWQRAGGFAITFPLKVGDYVSVHCAVNGTLVWRTRGGVNVEPGVVDDEFGLNGCWIVPGNFPDTRQDTLKNVNTEDFEIRRVDGGPVITIKPDGSVNIGGPSAAVSIAPDGSIQIKASDVTIGPGPGAQAVALAPLVEAAIKAAITGHVHTIPPTGGTTSNGVLAGTVSLTGAQNVKAT